MRNRVGVFIHGKPISVYPPAFMEPVFSRIGFYFLIWLFVSKLQHFVSIDTLFPQIAIPVFAIIFISHFLPHSRLISRRRYFKEKATIKHGECILNGSAIQYDFVRDKTNAVGEEYLLKPIFNRRDRLLFTFFTLAICSGTVLVLNVSRSPLVDMKVVLAAMFIDFFDYMGVVLHNLGR